MGFAAVVVVRGGTKEGCREGTSGEALARPLL